MEHVATILCLRTSVDEATGLFSLMDTVGGIRVSETAFLTPGLPLPVPIRVVSVWRRSRYGTSEKGEYKLRFRGDDGVLLPFPEISGVSVDLTDGEIGRSVVTVTKLPRFALGMWEFVVLNDSGQELGKHPFCVELLPQRDSPPNSDS